MERSLWFHLTELQPDYNGFQLPESSFHYKLRQRKFTSDFSRSVSLYLAVLWLNLDIASSILYFRSNFIRAIEHIITGHYGKWMTQFPIIRNWSSLKRNICGSSSKVADNGLWEEICCRLATALSKKNLWYQLRKIFHVRNHIKFYWMRKANGNFIFHPYITFRWSVKDIFQYLSFFIGHVSISL